jgi:hypothetical protein
VLCLNNPICLAFNSLQVGKWIELIFWLGWNLIKQKERPRFGLKIKVMILLNKTFEGRPCLLVGWQKVYINKAWVFVVSSILSKAP